jgi:hypothetical protein
MHRRCPSAQPLGGPATCPGAASQCISTAAQGARGRAARLQEPAHRQHRAERPADQAQVEHEHRHHPRVVRVLALPARAHAADQEPRSAGSRARARAPCRRRWQAGGSLVPAGTPPPAPWSRPPAPAAAPARGGRRPASGSCGPARAPPCVARPPRPARALLLEHARALASYTLRRCRRHGLNKAPGLHKSDACCGKCVSDRPGQTS